VLWEGLCDQAEAFGSAKIEASAEELNERKGFRGIREKFRKGMAKGKDRDELRRHSVGADGPDEGAKVPPNSGGAGKSHDVQESLGDEPQLNEDVVGVEFAKHLESPGSAVEVLIAWVAAPFTHGPKPEMIGVGAERVNGLFKAGFDFEADAEGLNDLKRAERQVGRQEDLLAAGRVNDQDKPDQTADRSPAPIEHAISKRHALFSVDGAGSLSEGTGSSEETGQFDPAPIHGSSARARR